MEPVLSVPRYPIPRPSEIGLSELTEKERQLIDALVIQGLGWSVDHIPTPRHGTTGMSRCNFCCYKPGDGSYYWISCFDPYQKLPLALAIADGMGLAVTLTAGARTVVHVDAFSRPPRAGMALSKQSAIRFWGINQPHPISTNATLATMLTECMLEMLGIK